MQRFDMRPRERTWNQALCCVGRSTPPPRSCTERCNTRTTGRHCEHFSCCRGPHSSKTGSYASVCSDLGLPWAEHIGVVEGCACCAAAGGLQIGFKRHRRSHQTLDAGNVLQRAVRQSATATSATAGRSSYLKGARTLVEYRTCIRLQLCKLDTTTSASGTRCADVLASFLRQSTLYERQNACLAQSQDDA